MQLDDYADDVDNYGQSCGWSTELELEPFRHQNLLNEEVKLPAVGAPLLARRYDSDAKPMEQNRPLKSLF
eukprot:scaffold24574_cov139-Skeletonema_marinoi.AAC.2